MCGTSPPINTMATLYRLLFCSFIASVVYSRGGGRPKNEYNYSLEDLNPFLLWPICSSSHNTDPNADVNTTLVQYGVQMISPGPYQGLSALEFHALPTAKVQITNYGTLDGDNGMCWLLYLNPTSAHNATVLQYQGDSTNRGLELRYTDTQSLIIRVYTGVTYQEFGDAAISVPPGSWTFVGVCHNILWVDEELDILIYDSNGVSVVNTFNAPFPNAHGDVTFGLGLDGSAFNGTMSCIHYYQTSLSGKALDTAFDFCDPNQWTSAYQGDLTADAAFLFVPTTTVQSTLPVSGVCRTFTKADNMAIAIPIEQHVVSDKAECVLHCNRRPWCSQFAVQSEAGGGIVCTLGTVSSNTGSYTRSVLYSLL
ncbi:uncharacterized protein LOC117318595 [Pecten maximus]|uniref:uncharacterized protein LOC117318595 n=1 Tax=Pecten maximus TaxID=6579 RepID=UPI00145901A5|nr:uncharacterized protein LOC117318595 [Pecten maximus]